MTHYLDYYNNATPKCPHCRADVEIWGTDRSIDLNYDDGGQTTFHCDACHRAFVCVTHTHYKFSTATSDDRAEEENWGPEQEAVQSAE